MLYQGVMLYHVFAQELAPVRKTKVMTIAIFRLEVFALTNISRVIYINDNRQNYPPVGIFTHWWVLLRMLSL